jgi:hypothetical protein
MNVLADADQSIFVATGNPQLFFVFRVLKFRGEFLHWFGVGGGRKGADPSERFKVPKAEIEGLTTSHRQTGDGPFLSIYIDRVSFLDRGIRSSRRSFSKTAKAGADAITLPSARSFF